MTSESKVIVITGVTKGLGFALSEWFMNNGHTVIGCGRSPDAIANLNAMNKSNSLFSVIDVGNATSVEGWARTSLEKFPAPDLVVNNAALANKPGKLWEVPLKEFDQMVHINIKGVNYVIHSFLPAMIKAKNGVIVNVSSYWGRNANADVAPYCCTKFAVEGLSMALAQEIPAPLACISLSPGMINTDMLHNYFGDAANDHQTPDQWAAKAGPFLLSLDRGCNGKQMNAP